MRPVVLLPPGRVDAFMAGKVLAALADADRLQLAVHDGAFAEIALVDAPDVDSVEAENRKTAEELLQAADLCLFVTTAQRYADYVELPGHVVGVALADLCLFVTTAQRYAD